MMIYLKNMAGFKMDFFKGMTYSEIRPIFKKHYNSIQAFLEKREKQIKEEGSKRKGKSLEQETTKKQRIDEDAEELKRHLQIVVNDDDDVYTEATPLASKVPVFYYQIHHENNKPYYKIIRVDGTHKLFLSFITLLKNFDRENLETLWKLVKERFKSIEPKNFSDDFLLNTLKIMFEKPHVETNLILLVKKKYPLTRFTLEQMLSNVRHEVKKESEMLLELLSETLSYWFTHTVLSTLRRSEKQALIDAEDEAIQTILTKIDNDIYSVLDACDSAKKLWISIKRLKQGENINMHDVETKLF
uniref:Uncharacterized protein n=1 Tax=Tanacetum cinerariifolium TaxID=118510 RepID=A0A6L2JPJ5_TANCI|nr:hypothetical protein [Tanacetum cinerariifolium]